MSKISDKLNRIVQKLFRIERTKMVGKVNLVLAGPDGLTKEQREVYNLITTNGKDAVLDQIGRLGSQPAAFTFSAIGSGTATPVSGNTLLASELSRVSGVYAHTDDTNNFTNTATFGAGVGTGAITEAGLFNVLTANTIIALNRQTFAVVNKGASDTLTVTWTITLT